MRGVFRYYECDVPGDSHPMSSSGFLDRYWRPRSRQCVTWTLLIALTTQCFAVLLFALYTWGAATPTRSNSDTQSRDAADNSNTLHHHDTPLREIIGNSLEGKPITIGSNITDTQQLLLQNQTLQVGLNPAKAEENGSNPQLSPDDKPTHETTDLYPDAPADPCESFNPVPGYHTSLYCLEDDKREYVTFFTHEVSCFTEGTDIAATSLNPRLCSCRPGWSGMYCSKPSVLKQSDFPSYYGVELKQPPRRVIHALPFTMEFDLLETRFITLNEVVDVFVILESNYSAAGTLKPRLLQERLNQGWMAQFHHKIIYLSLDYFPPQALQNGWIIDAMLRNYISHTLFNGVLKNFRHDDLFVLTDADELPMRDSLLFLRLHYGYPEPVGIRLRHNLFGFFWQLGVTETFMACTVGFLHYVLHDNAYDIRSLPHSLKHRETELRTFQRTGGRVQGWRFGTLDQTAGWHCSWCFPPDGVRLKMEWSQRNDTPRWGDYPEKKSLTYISDLIYRGHWYDGQTHFRLVDSSYPGYCPEYMRQNVKRFSYMLQRPSIKQMASDYLN